MEIDYDALQAQIKELTSVTGVADTAEELAVAANFVLAFGGLGDFLEEPNLTKAQFWTGPPGAAFGLLGHWSVQRNDPSGNAGHGFEVHAQDCKVCRFLEDIRSTRAEFADGYQCETCGGGLDAHAVGTHPADDVAMYCVGQWTRVEPDAEDMGRDFYQNQVSGSAWATSWWAPLTDGDFAVVTRTYYVGNNGHGQHVLCRTDDYIVCTDYDQPGATQIASEWVDGELDSDDPKFEDLHQLALDSFPPLAGEWQEDGPTSSTFAVPVLADT